MIKRFFILLLAIVASVGMMNAKVTWKSCNISDLDVHGTNASYSKEGVTLSANADHIFAMWQGYGDESHDGISFMTDETGGFTFSNSLGKNFTKIEMTLNGPAGWDNDEENLGSGWLFNWNHGEESITFTFTWTGNAKTVDLMKETSNFHGEQVKRIVFYFEGDSEEPDPTYTVALKDGTANADKVTLSATSVEECTTVTVTPNEECDITAFKATYNTTEELSTSFNTETGAYSFTMPAANVTIEATIALKPVPEGDIYAGFTATAGSGGFTNEGHANLVDNKFTSADWTKWCADNSYKSVPTGESGDACWWIDFEASEALNPTGYILTTGNDTGNEHGRNPKNWVLKAKLNADDAWTTIATVTNDVTMKNQNFKDYKFYVDQSGPYKYFRFEVFANQGANVMQLCQLRLIGTAPAPANSCGDGLIWELNGGALTISYTGTGTGVMDNYASMSDAPWYSHKDDITSVTITDGVKSVGSYSFGYYGNLVTVTIGNDVETIGYYAFGDCYKFTTLNLGNSVKHIGDRAFMWAKVLTGFTLPSTLETIGERAFLQNKLITSLTIPSNVTSIGPSAFMYCAALTSVTVEATTPPTLGATVFDGVPTSSIPLHVPSGSVAAYTAADQWKDFDIQDPTPAYETVMNLINAIGTVELTAECKAKIDAARTAYDALSDGDKALVTNIATLTTAEAAFENIMNIWLSGDCDAILWKDTTLTVRKHAGEGNGAMADYTDYYGDNTAPWFNSHWYNPQPGDIVIKSVTIEEGVTRIGDCAFGWMSELKTLTIPSSVTSIGEDAFYWSKAVDDIYLTADPSNLTWVLPYSADNQFKPEKATRCHVPADLLTAYQEKFGTLNMTFVGDLDPITPLTPEQQQALDAAKDKIAAIPSPVVYTPACKDAIDAARAAYDALTPDMLKQLVSNYATLTAAEATYESMKDVAVAEAKIAAIPQPVTLKLATRDSINNARAAYDALTADQKLLVSNYDVLTAAEATMATLNPGGDAPDGAVSGKFSIDESSVVYFSKGNLQATTADLGANWTWGFAANQWDLIGDAAANNAISGNGEVSENGTVDLFGWSTSATKYGIHNGTNKNISDYAGDFADWGATMGEGWFTLSKEQWHCLLNTRTGDKAATVNSAADCRYTKATINTDGTAVMGIILFPDGGTFAASEFTEVGSPNTENANYTTTCTTAQWTALQAKGCVFLPAAGRRYGAEVSNEDPKGYYWSSSPKPSTDDAYFVFFYPYNVVPASNDFRCLGLSVRLVIEAPASPLAAAQAVKDLIEAIPAEITLDAACVNAVQAARDAYNALSDATKGALDDATVQKLNQAITDYTALIQAGADEVIAKINNIPQPVTLKLATRDSIESARAAYDALTADQQALVTNYDVLEAAEAELATLNPGGGAPAGTLNGKFTINADGDQIAFSKGNLQATTTDLGANWTWGFAANQWNYLGIAVANNKISGNKTVSENGTVDLFGWSTAATYYGINNSYKAVDYIGDFVDWGPNMGAGWRTLTKDEWNYLIENNTKGRATVNDKNGYIFLPNDWSGPAFTPDPDNFTTNVYSGDDWTAMENAGAVFLPSGPARNGTYALIANDAKYCSSTSLNNDTSYVFTIYYNQSQSACTGTNRAYGCMVRLVTEGGGATPLDSAQAVKDLIDAIPTPVEYPTSGPAIAAALVAYQQLSDAAKGALDAADVQKMTDAATQYAALDAIAAIEAIPAEIVYDPAVKAAIETAREKYDALIDASKALVDGEVVAKLTNAEQAWADLVALIEHNVSYIGKDGELKHETVALLHIPDPAPDFNGYEFVRWDVKAGDFLEEGLRVKAVYTPIITTNPQGFDTLAYNGLAQELVKAGVAKEGHIEYSLYPEEPESWSANLPTATNAGVYAVSYKLVREGHEDYMAGSVTAVIAKAPVTYVVPQAYDTLAYNYNTQVLVTAGQTNDGTFEYGFDPTLPDSWSADLPQAMNAGTYNVYFRVNGDMNHLDSTAVDPIVVTIAKAELTATADDKDVIYGDAVPEYSVTYAGWQGEDDAAVLTGDIAFACDYNDTTSVGTYPIVPSGVDAANYTITFVNGKVTVAKAESGCTAPLVYDTLVYNGANQTLIIAGQPMGGEMQYSLDTTVLDCWSTSLPQAKDAGTYNVYYRVKGDMNHNDHYYDLITVSIAKAALTATADDKNVVYGDAVPEYTVSYSGWMGTDESSVLTGTIAFACTYAPTSNVDEYTITPSGVDAANYIITFVNGKVTVVKADLMITADDKNVIYGEVAPAFTASYSGWKNSDDASVVSGLTLTSEYLVTSNVGTYDIVPANATATNYAISFTNGTLTVNQAALTITANDTTVIYGDEHPEFTVTYAGWKNNDDESVVSGLQFTTTYAPGSHIGEYDIVPSGATAQNYAITFANGKLTVGKADVSVSGAEVHTAKFADGHAVAEVTKQGTLNGIKLNDAIAHVTTAAFSSADVAEHLTITLFYELTGDAALLKNYNLTPVSEVYTTEGVIIEPMIPNEDHQPGQEEQVEVQEGIDINLYGYCDGSGYSLKYHLNSGNPDQYKVDFADSRFTNVPWTALETAGKDGTIDITIPVDLPTGDYSMTVYFRDSRFDWLESKAFNATFHVNLPETYVRPLFDNTIVLVDTCECFTDIQWYYRNNSSEPWQIIEGATGHYYHADGKLTGEYFVKAKMNGVETYTCGQTDMQTLYGAGDKKQAIVRAYPNPVVNTTTVSIENSDSYEHLLRIVNLMGVELQRTTFEGNETVVDMDSYTTGNYTISVDGIVVKVLKQ